MTEEEKIEDLEAQLLQAHRDLEHSNRDMGKVARSIPEDMVLQKARLNRRIRLNMKHLPGGKPESVIDS